MSTLASFVAWLRLDLNDPVAARFADADLQRAVARAVEEYGRAAPRVRDNTLSTVVGSRDVSLATLTGLIDVVEVEWPTGSYPRDMVAFELSADLATLTLLVDSAPSAVGNVRVRWPSGHTVDGTSSTVPVRDEALVCRGAYGFACLAYSTPAADSFRYQDGDQASEVDQTAVPREWRARGDAALTEFRQGLGDLRQRRAVGARGRVVWSEPRTAPYWPVGAEREP